LSIIYTSQFKKDYKRIQRQNKNIDELRTVIKKLDCQQPLEPKYRDHKLTGYRKEHHECHIKSDWLLIYRFDGHDLILERTGSHSDLFKS
jgi:mRNA interferase YafQ